MCSTQRSTCSGRPRTAQYSTSACAPHRHREFGALCHSSGEAKCDTGHGEPLEHLCDTTSYRVQLSRPM